MVSRGLLQWAGRVRRHYLSPHLREKVLERDGYRCQICGATTSLDVHHLTKAREWPYEWDEEEHLEEFITVCKRCHHKIEHGNLEWAEEKLFQAFCEGLLSPHAGWHAYWKDDAQEEEEE